MDDSTYVIDTGCCTKPPNPWLPGAQVPQGCVCDANCVGPDGPVKVLYQSAYPDLMSVEEEINYLDSRRIAFSSDLRRVNTALDAALITPTSYTGTVNAIFSQDAAAAVNAMNASVIIAPQAAAVVAASSAITATTSARLAYKASCQAKAALDSIKNINNDELSVLISNVKLATDALVSASTSSSSNALAVSNMAGSTQSSADYVLTTVTTALRQIEMNAAVSACNAVPGSTSSRITDRENNIAITTAKREVELATISVNKAISAVNSSNTVAISGNIALMAANTASSKAIIAKVFFTNAAAANVDYNSALANYHNDSSNNALLTLAHAAKVALDAANTLLPPMEAINLLVSSAAQASYLANIFAANARTLSTSLDIEARAIATPVHNPVTPQMIATQTAAAERFGAAAAIAAARAARASAAPPVPPMIPPAGHAPYSARMPPKSISGGVAAVDERAQRAARAMTGANHRVFPYNNGPFGKC
jgi:hypothetical protein